MPSLPARTVQVIKTWHAVCALCPDWAGPDRATFADASADRQQHLDGHAEPVICDECNYPLRPCPACWTPVGHDGYTDHQCDGHAGGSDG